MKNPIMYPLLSFVITPTLVADVNKIGECPPLCHFEERQTISKIQRDAMIGALCQLVVVMKIDTLTQRPLSDAAFREKIDNCLGLKNTPAIFRANFEKYINSGDNQKQRLTEFTQFLMSQYGIDFFELSNAADFFVEKIGVSDLTSENIIEKAVQQTRDVSDFACPKYKFISIELKDRQSKKDFHKQLESDFNALNLNLNTLINTLNSIQDTKEAEKSLKDIKDTAHHLTYYLIQLGYARTKYKNLDEEIHSTALQQLEKYISLLNELRVAASRLNKKQYFDNEKLENIIQINILRKFEIKLNIDTDDSKEKEFHQAVKGDSEAQFALASAILEDAVAEGNENELLIGLLWLRKAASQNHASALNLLAIYYLEGTGIERDEAKAFDLFSEAAQLDHAEAQSNLALLYESGRGVLPDVEKALFWLQKSAEGNYAPAQRVLAGKFLFGNGLDQDNEKGLYWLKKSADQGDVPSLYYTGMAYLQGDIVPVDPISGVAYLEKAAAQNHSEAQYVLAFCYKNGRGVIKNINKAMELWEKAASQGHTGAQEQLILHTSSTK